MAVLVAYLVQIHLDIRWDTSKQCESLLRIEKETVKK
ncbi:hypothetical protein XM38_038910 [Halomicronema hongdechloris C2206]|uniref:Uncharacterized protein n=1 Tax=Halomicronema hongdechloris C2206 TaxID=1641165 RepID=A0A1Z3HRI5_9CYAN|nr:hypothetical protein XM38_038910 [Halomicronema hongdechloris C2206]